MRTLTLLGCTMAAAMPARAGGWSAEGLLGAAAPFTSHLEIHQAGRPDISLDATWRSRSFEFPLYYAARVARWNEGRAWTLNLVHLKLDLRNPPEDVQSFSVSHGYNLLTVGRLWQRGDWHTGGSAGLVVAHAENTVRGLELEGDGGLFGEGYVVGGPAAEATLGWARAARGVAFVLEGRMSLSHARVPVVQGHADVPIVALHGLFGMRFGGPNAAAAEEP